MTIDTLLDPLSDNPVENRAIAAAVSNKVSKMLSLMHMNKIALGKCLVAFTTALGSTVVGCKTAPLTFEAMTPNASVTFTFPRCKLKVSTDSCTTWQQLESGQTVTLASVGDKVSFMADGTVNTSFDNDYSTDEQLVLTGKLKVSGNIMSIVSEDYDMLQVIPHHDNEFPSSSDSHSTFNCLFYGQNDLENGVADASLLILPHLKNADDITTAYTGLFTADAALTSAPILSVGNSYPVDYIGVFGECESLKHAEFNVSQADGKILPLAFIYCDSLSSATFWMDKPTSLDKTFTTVTSLLKLSFPTLTRQQLLSPVKFGGKTLKHMLASAGLNLSQLRSLDIQCADGKLEYDISNFCTSYRQQYECELLSILSGASVDFIKTLSDGTKVNVLKGTFDIACSSSGAGNVVPFAVSRCVMAGAHHYDVKVTGPLTMTYGSVLSHVNRLKWTNLKRWAIAHANEFGWTAEETSAINSDIDMIELDKSMPLDDVFLPHFMTEAAFDAFILKMQTGFIEASDGELTLAWMQPQESIFALPFILSLSIDGSSINVSDLLETRENATYNTALSQSVKSFIPVSYIQNGNSGKPILVKLDGKDVVVGHFHTPNSGPSYPKHLKFIKKFVEVYEGSNSMHILDVQDID